MNEQIIDIYCRNYDIENIKTKIDVIKQNKNNAFIMIDGEWGSGKTTLLKLLKKQIENENNVIEYNCWENSFYPDPLIAIISSITEQMNKFNDINEMGLKLLSYLKSYNFSQFSVNIAPLIDVSINNENNNDINRYFSLESSIKKFKENLNNFNITNNGIDNKGTRIILVDELDRCLPEYAIKVLERLYLLLKDVNNVIVIITNNSKQLAHSIKQIFGDCINIDKYLEKFIDDTYKLVFGTLDKANLIRNFDDYFKNFSIDKINNSDFEDFLHFLIKNENPRLVARRFEKLNDEHKILFNKNSVDKAYICGSELLCIFFPTVKVMNIIDDIYNFINNDNRKYHVHFDDVSFKYILSLCDYKDYIYEYYKANEIDITFLQKINPDIKLSFQLYLSTIYNSDNFCNKSTKDKIREIFINDIHNYNDIFLTDKMNQLMNEFY